MHVHGHAAVSPPRSTPQVERLLDRVDGAIWLLDYTKLKTAEEAAVLGRLRDINPALVGRLCSRLFFAGACVRAFCARGERRGQGGAGGVHHTNLTAACRHSADTPTPSCHHTLVPKHTHAPPPPHTPKHSEQDGPG
jgi:hypothetical protein